MAVNMSGKLNLDGTGFNDSMKSAVQETAKLKREVDSANKTMNNFQRGLGGATSAISSMMNSFKTGDIGGFISGAKGAAGAITSMIPAAGGATAAVSGLGAAIYTALGPIGLIAGAIAGIAAITGSAISSVENFNKSLNGLSAITGVEGRELQDVGDMAIDMSQKFGAAATDIVDSMSKIGSQAPQLLKDMDALSQVTEAAIVLSKASDNMGVEESAKAITTVMNQMNVAGSESTEIINTLAAGAKEGAAEVDYLTTAIEKTGTQAKNAGVDYHELVAMIETIAPKISSAEVAGTGLSAMLIRLTTQTNKDFNPAIVGMEKALENLDKANLSAAEKLELFGRGGLTVADTLIKNREALNDMTNAVTNTNTAYEQMAIKGNSLETLWNKLKSTWDAWMITIGQSASIKALIAILGVVIRNITLIIHGLQKWAQFCNTVTDIIAALFRKLWTEGIKPYWDAIVNAVTNSAIYKKAAAIWKAIKDAAYKAIKYVTDLWNKFLEWLGISSGKANVAVKPELDTSELDPTKIDNEIKKKGGSKVKIDYDKGSLEDYKAQLQKLQDKLSKKKLSLIDIEKTKADIEKLKQIIAAKEWEIGIGPKPGSLEYIESEISKIDDKIKKLHPTIDRVKIEKLQIEKEALEKMKKDAEAAINGVTVSGQTFKTKGMKGSLQEAEDKVSYYKQRIQVTTETDPDYDYLVKNLKDWTEKVQVLRLKVEEDTSMLKEGTLKYLNNKVAKLKAEIETTAYGTPEYYKLMDELNEYTKQQKELSVKVNLDMSGAKTGSLTELQSKIKDLQAKINLEVYGSDEYRQIEKELKELTKEEQKIKIQMEVDGMDALEKVQTYLSGFHAIDGVVSSVDSLSKALNEDADAWTILMSTISVLESIFSAVNTVMEISNLLTNLSTASKTGNAAASVAAGTAATEQAAMEAATVAPKTAETLANKALEASILDLAAAQIFLAHAAIPFAGPAIAAGLISGMMAAMAAQHAASMALQAFEQGGVVKGNTSVGDNVLVRANAGELVLNQRQQNNLFKAIDENRLGTGEGGSGQVEFLIKGDKLYGVLKNYEKIHKK